MKPLRIAVVGTPRSGSSYFASGLESLGFASLSIKSAVQINPSQFNPEGYFEDTFFTLLTDQLIRFNYGNEYSFLHPPSVETLLEPQRANHWSFDLDEDSIEIPTNYLTDLEYYCGNSWDVWGLTRMLHDGKWNQIYSKLGLSTSRDLIHSVAIVRDEILSKSNVYVKDARLLFVLHYFSDLFTHIVYLTREPKSLSKSIQSHYGPRIFRGPEYEGFRWVSNHFNYKIPFLELDEFLLRYQTAAKIFSSEMEFLSVTLDEIDNIAKLKYWLTVHNLIPQ